MPEQQLAPAEKVHRYRCPGCGADLVFGPQDGALVCPYCGRREEIAPSAGSVEERSYEDYLRVFEDQLGTLAPAAALPFRLPPDEATARVRTWIGSLWFAPNALKKLAEHEGVGGVYLPFW